MININKKKTESYLINLRKLGSTYNGLVVSRTIWMHALLHKHYLGLLCGNTFFSRRIQARLASPGANHDFTLTYTHMVFIIY